MRSVKRRIHIGRRANRVISEDARLFFTTTRQPYPLVVERGDGDFIYDVEGNRFIDFTSFISVYNLGVNANQSIRDAAVAQMRKLMHGAFTEYHAELPVKFAKELLGFFPRGFGRVFLSNSGTEANEAALKIARIATRRPYVMAFYNAFHGRTKGSLALTASMLAHKRYLGPFCNVIHVPFPYCYRCPFQKGTEERKIEECCMGCMAYLEDYPAKREVPPDEIAAIFIEPVQGEGGYIPAPAKFIKALRRFATDNGILLVSDEVQAGYMRTGKFLSMDNFNVEADIYTMAKAVGGGLPLGVTVARSSLGDLPAGAHGTTFGGNLVSVAAAYESLRIIKRRRRQLEAEVTLKGAYMMRRLEKMRERYEVVGDVRGMGMMLGMELVKDKERREPAGKLRDIAIVKSFYKGLVLLPAGDSTIRLIPPLTISGASLREGMDILEEVIREIDSQRAWRGAI